jgi:hypothetical protein
MASNQLESQLEPNLVLTRFWDVVLLIKLFKKQSVWNMIHLLLQL